MIIATLLLIHQRLRWGFEPGFKPKNKKKGDYTRKISTLLESNPELLLVPQSPFRLEKLTENSPENFALAWRIFGEKLKNQSKMMIFWYEDVIFWHMNCRVYSKTSEVHKLRTAKRSEGRQYLAFVLYEMMLKNL